MVTLMVICAGLVIGGFAGIAVAEWQMQGDYTNERWCRVAVVSSRIVMVGATAGVVVNAWMIVESLWW